MQTKQLETPSAIGIDFLSVKTKTTWARILYVCYFIFLEFTFFLFYPRLGLCSRGGEQGWEELILYHMWFEKTLRWRQEPRGCDSHPRY